MILAKIRFLTMKILFTVIVCFMSELVSSWSSDPGNKTYSYATKYFEVPVDHFSFALNDTFKLRYLVNDTYWDKSGGPIFFYTGNEGDISMFALNTGFMWDIAPDFKAMLVFAEHRYYGESMPFGNKSLTEPRYSGYLTSEQALADYALLLTHMKSQIDGAEKSRVIAFGGSYGGMLAAWFRIKYPHIVRGAIAASAPVLQFTGLTPCEAFARIVTSDFTLASPECSKSIRNSWNAITNVTSTDAGKAWLSSEWHLCHPVKTADDVKKMTGWLTEIWINLAMVNYPYPANFLEPLPAHPVKAVCKHLPNSTLEVKPLLQSVFKAINVYFNYTGKTSCLNTDQDDSGLLGDEGWDFQACTEMVMPTCSDGKADMFEPTPWNMDAYAKECYKKWKVWPRPLMAPMIYGGKELSAASNIVFSNGLLDPWSSGGILKSISQSVIAIIIPEGAHHLDLRGEHPGDPQSVLIARMSEVKMIKKWLR